MRSEQAQVCNPSARVEQQGQERSCLKLSGHPTWTNQPAPGSGRDPVSERKVENEGGGRTTSTLGLHTHVHTCAHTSIQITHMIPGEGKNMYMFRAQILVVFTPMLDWVQNSG